MIMKFMYLHTVSQLQYRPLQATLYLSIEDETISTRMYNIQALPVSI